MVGWIATYTFTIGNRWRHVPSFISGSIYSSWHPTAYTIQQLILSASKCAHWKFWNSQISFPGNHINCSGILQSCYIAKVKRRCFRKFCSYKEITLLLYWLPFILVHQTKFRLYRHFSLRSGNFAWSWLATFTESIPKTQDNIVYKTEHCLNTRNNDIKASKEIAPEGNTVNNTKKKLKSATNKQTPWSESTSELYRPSDRRLSAKWLPTFADRGCHVVSVTDPHGRILSFLDRSRYFSIK
jgi:hypothetical protein